ncbi:MAG: hypothetical protein ABIO54_04425 [Pyrinomonadaceae bacterium]
MNKKCPACRLVDVSPISSKPRTLKAHPKELPGLSCRAVVCFGLCIVAFLGFYLSLIVPAKSLTIEEKATVRSAIKILKEKGFARDAALLDNFTVF